MRITFVRNKQYSNSFLLENKQHHIDFDRIAKAIEYMYLNYNKQPSLEEVASQVNLSEYHFLRMFRQWAGVSPKKFIQYLNIENAKKLIKIDQLSLFDTANQVGLSGSGRLHDLFVTIEGMTPGEYKNGGENLKINYTWSNTVFGKMLVASTGKGICYLAYGSTITQPLKELKELFPKATLQEQTDHFQRTIFHFFEQDWRNPESIKLHLKGTPFQLKVWETLLKIPEGELSTYGKIAEEINNPKANRAVGTAVGSNPVSYIIPCHRVIRASGVLGEYHWGSERKKAMIGYECLKAEKVNGD